MAIRRLSRDGVVLDLISVLHFGDRDAYERLGARFETYDTLLYEHGGGPYFPPTLSFQPDAEPAVDPTSKQSPTEQFCDLADQYKFLNLSKPNCVWADMSRAELDQRLTAKNENLPDLLQQSGDLSEFLDTIDSSRSWDLLRQKDGQILFKRSFAQYLASPTRPLNPHPVINKARTQRALEVLRKELESGHQSIGLLYGAGHMPDFLQELTSTGWKPERTEWYELWDLRLPEGTESDGDPR